MLTQSATLDKLCFYPVAQQAIGVTTILANIGATIGNIARVIFNSISAAYHKTKIKAGDPASKSLEMYTSAELDKKSAQNDLEESVKGIGIGVLRTIPIAGSIYSLAHLFVITGGPIVTC